MKTVCKRFLSLFLVLVMAAAMLPPQVLAAEPETGSSLEAALEEAPAGGVSVQAAASIEFLGSYAYNGHQYALYGAASMLSWHYAKGYCEGLGGHLATITSAEEETAIFNWYKSTSLWRNRSVYLGANNLSGEWEWVTGEKFEYTNWHQGEPSGYDHTKVEHYLDYYWEFTSEAWNDTNEYGANAFLCEWDQGTGVIQQKVPAGQYGILVVNSAGEAISGAQVQYGDQTRETDSSGTAFFVSLSSGEPKITVSCKGYEDYSNENTNYTKNAMGYDVVVLYSNTESEYRLRSAVYQNTTNGKPFGRTKDVLSGTKRLSRQTLAGGFRLTCAARKTAGVTGYMLMQNGVVIQKSATGEFDLNVNTFQAGGGVVVRVSHAKGYVDTPVNLRFLNDQAQKTYSCKLGDAMEITVPNGVPFFGGSKFSCDIPDLPIEIYVDSDATIHLGFNVKLKGDNLEDEMQSLYEKTSKLRQLDGKFLEKGLDGLKDFIAENEATMPAVGKVTINIIGYGEGKLDDDGFSTVKAELYLIVKWNKTVQGPTVMVGVIPVTYSVKVGADGKLSAAGSYDMKRAMFTGDLTFVLTPSLEAFGGVGVGSVIGVGVYGGGKLPIGFQFAGTSTTTGFSYVDLVGELGLKAYAAFLTYKKAWAYKTWHIYTRTGSVHSLSGADTPWMSGLYEESEYEKADLSYLQEESGWLPAQIRTLSAADAAEDSAELQPLLSSTYRNMQPVLGMAGQTPVLVWVRANTDRGEYDYPQLVYSLYQNGTWTEPQPVNPDNTTTDAAPALATAPDGTLYLAYQDSARAMTQDGTLSDYAAMQTIVTARFDAEKSEFTDFRTVSEPGVFSCRPVICADSGTPVTAWISNTENDYFMQNSTNRLCWASAADGWTRKTAAEGCTTVTALALGMYNGAVSLAAVTDDDCDLSTTDGRTLTLYPGCTNGQTAASGTLGGIAFAALPGETEPALLWFDETGLKRKTPSEADTQTVLETEQCPAEFTVLSDRIVYNAASGDRNSNLYALVYDNSNSSWSGAVQLTAQSDYLQVYSVAQAGKTTYLAAVQTDVTITNDGVEDDCTLAWTVLEPTVDLELCTVSADHTQAQAGGAVPVYVDVRNNGDQTISTYTVEVSCGGSVAGRVLVSEPLGVSEETTVTVPVQLDAAPETKTYTVTVRAADDRRAENDTAELELGYSDLSVSAELYQVGDSSRIIARVCNNGAAAAGGTLRAMYGQTILYTAPFAPLAQGESSFYEVSITREDLDGAEAGMIRFELETEAQDYDVLNDTCEVYVHPSFHEKIEIRAVEASSVQVKVDIDTPASLWAAVYVEGRLENVISQQVGPDTDTVRLALDTASLPAGSVIKVFLVDPETGSPRAQSMSWTIQE